MNLFELKSLVSGRFQVGEVMYSIQHGTEYTFAGMATYKGRYAHHKGKRVFVLDTNKPSTNRITLFFELLLPLVNAYLCGRELNATAYPALVSEVLEIGQQRQYPDSVLHKYYYLAAASAIGKKAEQLQPVAATDWSERQGEISR